MSLIQKTIRYALALVDNVNNNLSQFTVEVDYFAWAGVHSSKPGVVYRIKIH